MTAIELYTALIAMPITVDRLRKANKRADTDRMYASVLERLAAEGRWPIRDFDPGVPVEPVITPPAVSPAALASTELAMTLADPEPLPGDVTEPAKPKKKRTRKTKKASNPVGKKKRPKY